ncbi:MAG TPA: methyltransferase domain-containing protein [Lacipirellulaceae bacterium]|nr:methyltransferase domain-containing protein [Lacipirellulaceae bacterium]
MRQRLADYRVFWRQFRQAYNSTGAVLPSGRGLSVALSRYVRSGGAASAAEKNDLTKPSANPAPRRILEVGPGTGAVTLQIIHDMRPNDQLVLVERNEHFVAHLRQRLNSIPAFQSAKDRVAIVHSSVEDLADDEPFDLIISGLPLNNFAVDSVEQILAKLGRLLAPCGTLSFFEYVAIRRAKSLVCSRKDRGRLRGIARVLGEFLRAEVKRDLVLSNVPPAWVHHVQLNR